VDELVLFIKLSEKKEHVSIGSLAGSTGGLRMSLNLLRLGAASVILFATPDDKDQLKQSLPDTIRGYTNPNEEINFSFENISEKEIKITIVKE